MRINFYRALCIFGRAGLRKKQSLVQNPHVGFGEEGEIKYLENFEVKLKFYKGNLLKIFEIF